MIAMKIDTNAPIVAQRLVLYSNRLRNWTVPLKAFGRILVRSVTQNFEAEARPKAWKPLALATLIGRVGGGSLIGKKGQELKRAQKRLSNVKILQDSGLLKNSARAEVTGNTLRVGPSGPAAIYAAIHQFGGKAGRGRKITIPARPFLLVQPEDETELLDLIRNQIERETP